MTKITKIPMSVDLENLPGFCADTNTRDDVRDTTTRGTPQETRQGHSLGLHWDDLWFLHRHWCEHESRWRQREEWWTVHPRVCPSHQNWHSGHGDFPNVRPHHETRPSRLDDTPPHVPGWSRLSRTGSRTLSAAALYISSKRSREIRKYLWKCKEGSVRQPGMKYCHTVDFYHSCLRTLLPTVPHLGPV